jgi:hypothetical protein
MNAGLWKRSEPPTQSPSIGVGVCPEADGKEKRIKKTTTNSAGCRYFITRILKPVRQLLERREEIGLNIAQVKLLMEGKAIRSARQILASKITGSPLRGSKQIYYNLDPGLTKSLAWGLVLTAASQLVESHRS